MISMISSKRNYAKLDASSKKEGVLKKWTFNTLNKMGVIKAKMPSRRWMSFWAFAASLGAYLGYDRYQVRLIRKEWMEKVSHLGEGSYDTNRLPRKLTIFVAPPPDGFLDESMKCFRKYVKPIINSAAIDMEVYTEEKQGEIRTAVASKIRELRQSRSNLELQGHQDRSTGENLFTHFQKSFLPWIRPNSDAGNDDVLVNRQELYSPVDVLGFYYKYGTMNVKRDDESDPEKSGGVICVGRGSYKEYIWGIHEGLLGPLEEPKRIELNVTTNDNSNDTEKPGEDDKHENVDEDKSSEREKDQDEKSVSRPYVFPSEYGKCELAPELDFGSVIRNSKNVPVLFEQPVYAFLLPKVYGFLKTPEKIYNFFNRRKVAEDYCEKAAAIVFNLSKPYQVKDEYMGKEEEINWPHKWLEKAKQNNADWAQPFAVDKRVVERMRVYDPQSLAKYLSNGSTQN